MKPLLFLVLLSWSTQLQAQEESIFTSLFEAVTEPQELPFEMSGDIAFKNGFERVPGPTDDHFYRPYPCIEGADLAMKTGTDSFTIFRMPFTLISMISPLKLDSMTNAYAVYGYLSCYGSGGGVKHHGFAIITIDKEPMLLFRIFYSCAQETFAKFGVTEKEAEENTWEYFRNINIRSDKITITDKPDQEGLSMKGNSCEMTDIKSGIFQFRNGRYERIE